MPYKFECQPIDCGKRLVTSPEFEAAFGGELRAQGLSRVVESNVESVSV